jgi:hypothetical protein
MDEVQKEIDQYADYLNAISRTRLLFNTSEELVAFTGYKLAGTTFSKYGGNHLFAKRAAFEALDEMRVKSVDKDYHLRIVLEDYKRASDFYTQFKRHRYFCNNTDSYVELIEYCYGKRMSLSDSQLATDIGEMDKGSVTIADSIIPILILISAGIIPSYWNKKAHDADINADFATMVTFVMEMVEKSSEFSMQPIISRFRAQQDDEIPKNRFYLIRCFEIILLTLRQRSSPELMTQATNNLCFRAFNIDGIWKAEEREEYWRFKRLDEDLAYYAYRYMVTDQEIWLYERYEVVFADAGKSVSSSFTSSDAIEDLVKNGEILPEHISLLAIEFDDPDSPSVLTLIYDGADGLDIACTLSLVKDVDEDSSLTTHIEKGISIKPDKDYQLYTKAVAITKTHVYYPVQDDGAHYYKVPRTPDNNGLLLEDFCGIKSKSLIALGSGKNLVFYDVTDETARNRNGIEIVESIQIE